MKGNRLEDNMDGKVMMRHGDYYLVKDDQGIKLLWAILPNGFWIRLPARQLNEGNPPKENLVWEITENPDGTVTVDPSIECWAAPTKEEAQKKGPDFYWHGYLKAGVFT